MALCEDILDFSIYHACHVIGAMYIKICWNLAHESEYFLQLEYPTLFPLIACQKTVLFINRLFNVRKKESHMGLVQPAMQSEINL